MTGHELDNALLELGAMMDAVNAGRTRLSKAQRREIEAVKFWRHILLGKGRRERRAKIRCGPQPTRDRDDFLAEMAKLGLGKGAVR